MAVRDVIIVGAGPSGLSAAIAAKRCGLDYQVVEQGVLVNSIYHFPPQMVFFTTPELLEIGGLPFVSPYDKPTRAEALRYYRKVVDTYDLQISYGETVVSIERELTEAEDRISEVGRVIAARFSDSVQAGENAGRALAPDRPVFAVESRSSRSVRRVRHGRNVVFAIGYYDAPNLLGVPGEDLPHVHHYYKEPHPYYRRRVVIVGGGNSAAEWALELFRAGAHVTLVHRHPELKKTIKYWVRPDIENRIKEGSIAARFNACVTEIRPTSVLISSVSAINGEQEELPADEVFLLVGYHTDWDLMERAGVSFRDRRVPTYDSETFETNVPGLFLAGGAICGRDTSNIFIENGRFHGEKIIATIAARQLEG
jgi:bacillithiol disulfide reductase